MVSSIVAIALFTIPTSTIASALIQRLSEDVKIQAQLEKIRKEQKKLGKDLKEFKQSEEQIVETKPKQDEKVKIDPEKLIGFAQSNNCPHCGKEISFITQIKDNEERKEKQENLGDSLFDYFRKSVEIPSHKRTLSSQGDAMNHSESKRSFELNPRKGIGRGHKRTISNQSDLKSTDFQSLVGSIPPPISSSEIVKKPKIPEAPKFPENFFDKEDRRKISFDPKNKFK
jgi:hypothetical protein